MPRATWIFAVFAAGSFGTAQAQPDDGDYLNLAFSGTARRRPRWSS